MIAQGAALGTGPQWERSLKGRDSITPGRACRIPTTYKTNGARHSCNGVFRPPAITIIRHSITKAAAKLENVALTYGGLSKPARSGQNRICATRYSHRPPACFMQRQSPVIFWLLIAATFSIDAVTLVWVHTASSDVGIFGWFYGEVLLYSMLMSQLSVVAIWYVFTAPRRFVSLIVPLAAIAAATLLSPIDQFVSFADHASWYGTHTFVLMILLWQMRRSSLWQRLSHAPVRERWSFSLAHLVILMTAVAVLLIFVRYANVLQELPLALLVLGFLPSVLLAIAAAMIWVSVPTKLFRIVLIFAVAIAVSWPMVLLQRWIEPMSIDAGIVPGYLIQALFLAIWLELGGILPTIKMG
jgi:hypothetical protein